MANFATIKAAIIAIVQAQTSYFESAAVLGYEPRVEDVANDPFVTVIPSGNANDYASTTENRRAYAFSVRIYHARTAREEQAEANITAAVDALLDAFDNKYSLDGLVLMLSAAPSGWGYVPGEKEYRFAEIKLLAKADYTISP